MTGTKDFPFPWLSIYHWETLFDVGHVNSDRKWKIESGKQQGHKNEQHKNYLKVWHNKPAQQITIKVQISKHNNVGTETKFGRGSDPDGGGLWA